MILLKRASVPTMIPLRERGVLTIHIPRKESVRIVSILTRSRLVASRLVIRTHVISVLMISILVVSRPMIRLLAASMLSVSLVVLSRLEGSILMMGILIASRVVTSILKISGKLRAGFVFA